MESARKSTTRPQFSQPIDWRAQHGSVENLETARAGQTRAAVQAPLERYYARKLISGRMYDAGRRLYQSYATGIVGVRDGEGGSGEYSPSGYSDAQLAAAQDYRRAIQGVGNRMAALLTWVVIEEVTLEKLQAHTGTPARKMMGALHLALDSLADHYRMPD